VAISIISADNIIVSEGDAFADFIVRLDAPNTGTVTVNYSTFSETASKSSDVVGLTGTLTFAAGETAKTVRMALVNDTAVEGTESFGLELSGPSANATLAHNIATATIIDNDAPTGTPVVSINDFVIDEAAKTASFVITLDRPGTSTVVMKYATQNGTALAGSDYVATSGTLSFAPGETAKTVFVTLLNDSLAETSEAFNLVLSNLSAATSADPVGTAIIYENDAPKVASSIISADNITVSEGDAFADFIVRLDAPNTGTVTVNYSTFSETASKSSDVVGLTGTLTFAAGETAKTVRMALVNDTAVEGTESFGLELSGPSANATLAHNIATATIIDNDAPTGTPVVNLSDAVVDENDGLAYITVSLDKPSLSGVTVNYAIQNVTATGGADFINFPAQTLSFLPGATAKQIIVGLPGDTVSKPDEIFDVVATSVTGATLGDSRSHVVIAGNDAAPLATSTISVADVAAVENDGFVDFLVRLDTPNTSPVTVNYQTNSGTASKFNDIVSLTGKLTFAAGETAKTVRIALVNDTAIEAMENFILQLSSPSANAILGNSTATATLIDDDSAAPATPIAIAGTAGPDILRGTRFADALTGVGGNDVLIGNGGADSMAGGTGNDTYLIEDAGDTYTEAANAGTDTVISYLAALTLNSNVENLTLAGNALSGTGNSLVNKITGTDTANTLDGGTGADVLNGGLGDDTYIVDNNGDTVVEVAGGGTDTVKSSVNYTLGTNVEKLTLTGAAALNGTGNTLNNLLTGNAAANTLDGKAGADSLAGGLGNDTYIVDNVGDVVTETSSLATEIDLVNSSVSYTLTANIEKLTLTGTAALNGTGNTLNNVLTGNAAANTLDGKAGADSLAGGLGNDTYIVDNVGDVVTETSALAAEIDLVNSSVSYTLTANLEKLTLTGTAALNGTGNTLNNVLTGNTAANTLDGKAGADKLTGGLGNDTYIVDNAGDVVTESSTLATEIDTVKSSISYTLGTNLEKLTLTGSAAINGAGNALNNTLTGNAADNVLSGGAGADQLSGSDGADTLYGNEDADTLDGGVGTDFLDGGAGTDKMTGGLGNDSYIIDNAGDVVTETSTLATEIDTVYSAITYTLGANVEVLTLTGTAAINGTGNTLDNVISGNTAANLLSGGDGADQLNGNAGADTLQGGTGTDFLDGGAGADKMTGGLGNDSYIVDNTGDVVTETSTLATEIDTVYSAITYTLGANLEILTLTGTTAINGIGNTLDNALYGNKAANILSGGAGADQMTGGLGNDTYAVDNVGDAVTETSTLTTEIDTVNSSVSYTLGANLERLTLTGAAAINGTGNTLSNILTGNTAANKLTGGDGADLLIGGTGKDTCTLTESVAATDTVRIAAGDSLVGSFDVATGFKLGSGVVSTTGVDKLDLATTVVAANAATVDGIDSGIIHSHSIVNGLIRFDDVDSYTTPLTLTAADLSSVFSYLQNNITSAGSTVEFNALGNTYVFQDGGANDTLVQLTGVTATSITTTGLAVDGLWIV